MFKFGNSILKTEYIKKECFRKEIMISTVLSLIVIGLLIALAVVFSNVESHNSSKTEKVILSENTESIYGEWKPGKMFVGNTILGTSQPLTLEKDSLKLGEMSFEIESVNHETTLPNGAVVFIIKAKKDSVEAEETTEVAEAKKELKSYPFIMTNKNEAILQLSDGKKIGMSYTR